MAVPQQPARFTHKRLGIVVSYSKEWGWDVQASLPRVLFGSNRKLIANQIELDQAQTKLARIVSAGFEEYQDNLGFFRVDLCWYIRGSADDFIHAHQDLELPESKGGKVAIYMRESITWETKCERNKKPAYRIVMYDKHRQRLGKNFGEALRIEAQLNDRPLKPRSRSKKEKRMVLRRTPLHRLRLPNQKGRILKHLDFDRCHTVLREIFLGFPAARPMNPKTGRLMRNAKRDLERKGIKWESLLPLKPSSRPFPLINDCEVPPLVLPAPLKIKKKPLGRPS